jgi:Di-haem oxidoreductase, putative peroxidase
VRRGRLLRSATAAAFALAAAVMGAQVWENANDPTGILIPYRLIHLVHGRDLAQAGTSGELRSRDPFLFFQLGRDLLHRQYTLAHGIYGRAGSLDVPLYVSGSQPATVHGAPARFARDHSASCGMCHSSVFREPSAGQTIGSTGGMGRNTPHFYGAGLMEMLGEQVRATVLARYDKDGDGLIDRAEIVGPSPVQIRPTPDAEPIDYGDLRPGPDGVPRLNTLFRLWYVDAEGRVLPDVVSLADPRAAAYGFSPQPFGWGRGRRLVGKAMVSQGGEATTLREFFTVAADFHLGLQAFDPTQLGTAPAAHASMGAGGPAATSLNGALQFDFGGSPDPGRRRSPSGLSLDDPDRDGHLNELTEGDIDAIEFYLLHTPPPAVRATARSESGRQVLRQVGCMRCHVESWRLAPAGEIAGFAGDRRLFRLETRSQLDDQGVSQVLGKLVRSDRLTASGERTPAAEAAMVERIYTDFKHWDIGPGFAERRFDGSLQREHRTAPLWGVGSGAPYGHDGRYLSLDEAIRAHAGAAEAESAAYRKLPAADRLLLIEYLNSLVLYPTDEIPADIDGDGIAAEELKVADQPVGYERFDARFLFANPPRYRPVGAIVRYHGRIVPAALIENIVEIYRLDVPFRVDKDEDGFPDAVDPAPGEKGVSDAR